MKRLFLILLVALSGHALCAATRPNLVLFIADDLNWDSCSPYGEKEIRTPNMDRLAAAGMTFDRAFVASPSCAPSRGALLTGRMPNRNGAMLNHQPPRKEVKKWPAYFQELGYETVAIGKVAHYAQVRGYGFDFVSHFTYHDDACIGAAVEWLKERSATGTDKPLCLLVGTNFPHVPWPAKSSYDPAAVQFPPTQLDTPETRAARARYEAAVGNADRDLGLVYDAARELLGENTLFLFTSDHGAQFPFGKWNCTEEALRTPLIAAWAGHIATGTRTGAMVNWVDILPTMLEAAGGKPPGNDDLDGQSFLAVLRGEKAEHRDHVFATHSGDGKMNRYPIRSVRTSQWRYVRNLNPEGEFHSHVDKVDDEHYWASWAEKAKSDSAAAAVVGRYFKRDAEELYDIRQDPWELHNLASDPARAATLNELRASLDEWMRQQGDEGMKTENALPKVLPGGKD